MDTTETFTAEAPIDGGPEGPSRAALFDAATGYTRRRTFAIISHPDAGKTTLTEKLLLESGAIRLAGQVKERGERRRTRSDWMEIEQKRGISISSSVMTFEYDGLVLNLLDTPGHADFSEDTYRTLTAVDSAIMVIDAAKGIEAQTRKLFEVCRLRDIPIITFVNKIDREGRDPLEILDEIMSGLALDVAPITWPMGMGTDFRGLVAFQDGQPVTLTRNTRARETFDDVESFLTEPRLTGDPVFGPAMEAMDIARASLPSFDLESYRQGHMTPVIFGSAMREIGVRELLDAVRSFAPPPLPQPAEPKPIEPAMNEVSGFVLKIQANMDPNHRDRVAFVRLTSGVFKRGMKLKNVRSGKELKIASPMFFFAREREVVDEAVAGDIVGIPNHGTLSVGDTLTEGSTFSVTGIPSFAPELIRRVRLPDAMKVKQMTRALNDLAEEGVTQVFRPMLGSSWLVGVVGALQLDVLVSRLEVEYGVTIMLESAAFDTARWVSCEEPAELERFVNANKGDMAFDRAERPVFLARSAWDISYAQKNYPQIVFSTTREIG
ncbi:peptide chain release factor 3 [Mangrovibrevibacter kandeliae]|uniref:peptide chain release factor 3 n=1 Tax=Mangrovibrevibacter kandeliae TaxID=2968473 RepID=UPI00211941E6|nr:peptide chain release factor 3 [Aurantimonas sp. CSK15Z-1]MCQ8781501.1 peptide chain release factor 3 [Aurantimonas sp. CSK15Z-1]